MAEKTYKMKINNDHIKNNKTILDSSFGHGIRLEYFCKLYH